MEIDPQSLTCATPIHLAPVRIDAGVVRCRFTPTGGGGGGAQLDCDLPYSLMSGFVM